MEKNVFSERQPHVLYSKDKALVLINEREIVEKIGGMGDSEATQETERTSYEYDSYWLDGVVKGDEKSVIDAAKRLVISDITSYDSSTSVNAFVLNGSSVWLDKATRVGLMNSTNIAKAMGNEVTTLWLGEMKIEVECGKAIQLLSALEMYALSCYNVTASHKKAVNELDDVEAILAYDYKQGYPDKLAMEV